MTRVQFWLWTISAVLVAILVATDLVLTAQEQKLSRDLGFLERALPEGQRAYQNSQLIATRVYQLSGQDPALKQLMVREKIIVRNNNPPAAPPHPAPGTAPAPAR